MLLDRVAQSLAGGQGPGCQPRQPPLATARQDWQHPDPSEVQARRQHLPPAHRALDTARFTNRPELDEAAALRYLAWVLVRQGDLAAADPRIAELADYYGDA